MNTVIVVYTNENGFKEFRKVPEGTLPPQYRQGILIGPPALDGLDLSKKQKQALNNFLVENEIANYSNLSGKRGALLEAILGLGFKGDKAVLIKNSIIAIYQREAFPESFDLEEDINGNN